MIDDMKYDDCTYCGGEVSEQHVELDYRYQDQLHVFKNIAAGVCHQCGEKFLKAKVAKEIENTIKSNLAPSEVMQVPVHAFR
jgi:YgiT-type zinc finger domain-containing protein